MVLITAKLDGPKIKSHAKFKYPAYLYVKDFYIFGRISNDYEDYLCN